MNWFTLALISTVLFSTNALLQRALMKEKTSDPYTHSVVFQIVVAGVLFIYAQMFTGFDISNVQNFIPNIVLMTLLYGIGNIALFTAYRLIDAAEVQILLALSSIWAVVGAIVFLNESLTLETMLGIASIVFGSIIISYKKGVIKLNKGYIYGFITSLMFGFAITNDAYLLSNFNVPSYMSIAFLFPGLLLLSLKPQVLKNLAFYADTKRLITFISVSIVYGTAAVAVWGAYKAGGNVSQIIPISQSSVVLTVMFAYFFLKEKDRTAQKFVGAALAFVGIILLG